MFMKEPKAEFVPIDLKISAEAGSVCPDWVSNAYAGGGQRCIASQIDAHGCIDWDVDIPWDDSENNFTAIPTSAPRTMRHR